MIICVNILIYTIMLQLNYKYMDFSQIIILYSQHNPRETSGQILFYGDTLCLRDLF